MSRTERALKASVERKQLQQVWIDMVCKDLKGGVKWDTAIMKAGADLVSRIRANPTKKTELELAWRELKARLVEQLKKSQAQTPAEQVATRTPVVYNWNGQAPQTSPA